MSLIGLVSDFSRQFVGCPTQQIRIFHKKGSILPQLRQQLVEDALKQGASHMLFVDSDQVFPAETLRALYEHHLPVVAANIPTKMFPANPTARKMVNGKLESVYSTERATGLERVDRVGTGIMLLDMRVFARLGPKPWFNLKWKEETGDFMGEDWYFCELLEKAGYNIYIDHDLSREIGHIGSLTYTHDLILRGRLEEEVKRRELNAGLIPKLSPSLITPKEAVV